MKKLLKKFFFFFFFEIFSSYFEKFAYFLVFFHEKPWEKLQKIAEF